MGLLFRRRRPPVMLAAATSSVAAKHDEPPSAPAPARYTGSDPVAELQRLTDQHAAGEISDAQVSEAKRNLMGI